MGRPLSPPSRRPTRLGRPARLGVLALAALGAALLVAPGLALGDVLTPDAGPTSNATDIDTLYKVALYIALVVFVGVEATLVYCLFRFRARRGAVPAQIRGNTRLEVGWTVGAALILVVLSVLTFAKLPDIQDPENSGPGGAQLAGGVLVASTDRPTPPDGRALNIIVNGQQFLWRYTYPDGDRNVLNNPFSYEEMVVPTNTTVTLEILSQDVAHSWWIPDLGGKMDAIPGYTNYTWFKITKPGVFRGQCAELCGRNHADMVARVRAVPPPEYEAWLARRKRDIAQARDAAAAEALNRIQEEETEETPQERETEESGAGGGGGEGEE